MPKFVEPILDVLDVCFGEVFCVAEGERYELRPAKFSDPPFQTLAPFFG
jgi:hypothetical protein